MKKTTWVVVADEAIARILQLTDTGTYLDPVEELTDPAAHASNGDLRRDAQGRRGESVTSSAGETGKHKEAELFASRVAAHLYEALNQQRFEALRIAAAPRFLGLLRKAMHPNVAKVVTGELDKDLVHMDNDDIAQRVFTRPAPVQG